MAGTKKSGRRPLSPEVKKRNGTYAKDPKRENKSAPKADGLTPEPPEDFNEDEHRKWKELVTDLNNMGVMSSETREMLIAYCTAYGGWMEARRKVRQTGIMLVTKDENGKAVVKRNPFSAELHKYRDEMNRLLPEFGLTPASRGRLVSINEHNQDNPFAGILERMSGNN